MRGSSPQRSSGFLINLGVTAVLVAVLAFASATPASATLGGTSAGATIHNVVKVDYKLASGGATATTYSVVDVTVLTVPTTASWSIITPQTSTGGTVVNYSATLRSNANGPDSYALGQTNGTATNADVQTLQGITTATPQWLWGGITTQLAATAIGANFPGTIGFPGGSVLAGAHPLAVNNIIELTTSAGTRQYLVTAISATGHANTQAAGMVSNEVYDVVTATPVINIAANQLGTVTVSLGTQVGQVATVAFNLTAGNPTLPGTPGTDVTNLSAQGASTQADGITTAGPAATSVTTTITSTVLQITKTSRILASTAVVNSTTNIDPASYNATTKSAKTGQIIEYHITVTNPVANSTASSVVITDPTPAYTTVVPGSQSSGTVLIGATPVTPVTVTAGLNTRVWETLPKDFGPLPANTELHIVYQVTVN